MLQTSDDGQVTLRWLDQKSTITSKSCRLDQQARAMWAWTRSIITAHSSLPTVSMTPLADSPSRGQRRMRISIERSATWPGLSCFSNHAARAGAPPLLSEASSCGVAP